MNKKVATWIAGGLLTATVFAFGYNTSVGSAAENATEQKPGQTLMMQMGQQDMSKLSPEEMQKQCQTMMSNPEMQKMMEQMMNNPDMQKMMQQNSNMMQNSSQPGAAQGASQTMNPAEHASHHQ